MIEDSKHQKDVSVVTKSTDNSPSPVIVKREQAKADPSAKELDEHEHPSPLASHREPSLAPPTLTADDVEAASLREPTDDAKGDAGETNANKTASKPAYDEAKVEQLIKDKTYALPISKFKGGSKAWIFVLVLTILVASSVVAYYLIQQRG